MAIQGTPAKGIRVNPSTKAIKVAGVGAQGPPGPQGPVATTWVFQQVIAATVWNIPHNLDKYPSVTIVQPSGEEVIGDVQYVNTNNVAVYFSAPTAGSAYLN